MGGTEAHSGFAEPGPQWTLSTSDFPAQGCKCVARCRDSVLGTGRQVLACEATPLLSPLIRVLLLLMDVQCTGNQLMAPRPLRHTPSNLKWRKTG